jgi:hypothetical protein
VIRYVNNTVAKSDQGYAALVNPLGDPAVWKRIRKTIRRRGWLGVLAAPPLAMILAGCGSETVEVKGGTNTPTTAGKVTAKQKAAAQAEEVIFQKSKKLR